MTMHHIDGKFADLVCSCIGCSQATYADNLLAKEENWRAKVPETAVIAEALALRLQDHHLDLQAQRVTTKQELIRQYTLQPIHSFPVEPSAGVCLGQLCLHCQFS